MSIWFKCSSPSKIASKANTAVFDEDCYFTTQVLNNNQTRHLWIIEFLECMSSTEGKLWANSPFEASDGFSCAGRLLQVIANDESLVREICKVTCSGIDNIEPQNTTNSDSDGDNEPVNAASAENPQIDNSDNESEKSADNDEPIVISWTTALFNPAEVNIS
jgi:hypothetical protein